MPVASGSGGDPSAAESDSGDTTAESDISDTPWFLWLLLFGLAGGLVLVIYRFLDRSNERSHGSIGRVLDKGLRPELVLVTGTVTPPDTDQGNAELAKFGDVKSGTIKLALKGSRTLTKGVPEKFEVVSEKDEKPLDTTVFTVDWKVLAEGEDTEAPKPEPANLPSTHITINQTGQFIVQTTINGDTEKALWAIITVVDPSTASSTSGVKVPFFGQGWASAMIAVPLLVIVATLGLQGVISGEGVISILSAIAGYLFGVASKEKPGDGDSKPE